MNKWTIFNKVCRFLSYVNPAWHIKLRYLAYNKKLFPDNSPKTFIEKLLWLRIHYYNDSPFVAACADKVKVRKYVEAVRCGEYLNELYGVYDSVDDVPWDSLPDQFAIKWNFGSGYNIICKDVKLLDLRRIKATMKTWGEEEYWVPHAEMQYRKCEKKILIEKYLGNDEGAAPSDYKLYCFNGKCRAILYMAGRDENGAEIELFYSPDWDYLGPANQNTKVPTEKPCMPKTLQDMIRCSELLSNNIPFVRVDFYEYNNRAYFGEMTFSPASGFAVYHILLNDKDMGDYIDLSETELNKFKELEKRHQNI